MKNDDNSTVSYQPWMNLQLNSQSFPFVYHIFPSDQTNDTYFLKVNFNSRRTQHISNMQKNNEIPSHWQPEFDKRKKCSMILLDNLLQPRIFMVDCHSKLSTYRVVCRRPAPNHPHQSQHAMTCPSNTIKVIEQCVSVHYKQTNSPLKCLESNLYLTSLLMKLPNAISSIFQTMAMIQGKDMTYVSPHSILSGICKTAKFFNPGSSMLLSRSVLSKDMFCNESSGVFLCTINRPTISESHEGNQHTNTFWCRDVFFVSSLLLCDGTSDCLNGADEEFCSKATANKSYGNCDTKKQQRYSFIGQCLLWQNEKGLFKTYDRSVTSHLCETTLAEHKPCEDFFSGRQNQQHKIDDSSFVCNDGHSIFSLFVNDGIPDCAEEEDETIFPLKPSNFECQYPSMLPCGPGSSKCFHISHMCLKRRHPVHGHLENCRNGAHLIECQSFTCNGHFKCPGYFCVHLVHKCDGIVDCPNIEDEKYCSWDLCKQNFKCKTTPNCIHMQEVCDGILHCPLEDDESVCDVRYCWNNCICLNYAFHCESANASSFPPGVMVPHIYISFTNTQVQTTLLEHFTDTFRNSTFIFLNHDNLTSVCLRRLQNVLRLNVDNNRIQEIFPECFSGLQSLKFLSLRQNLINALSDNSLKGLNGLVVLDISFNKLTILREASFLCLPTLSTIRMRQNPLFSIHVNSLSKLFPSLRNMDTDDFRICCLNERESVSCRAQPPWPSSCGNILQNSLLQGIFLSVMLLILPLNFASFWIHAAKVKQGSKSMRENPSLNLHLEARCGYLLTVLLINLSEAYFSIYLLTILYADISYQDSFPGVELWWRSSVTCHSASFVYLQSTLLSHSTIVFLAFSRNRLIVCPLKTSLSKFKYVKARLISGSCVSIGIAMTPTLVYRFAEQKVYMPSSLCLLIGNMSHTSTEMAVSIVLAALSFMSVVLNVFLYCQLIASLADQAKLFASLRDERSQRSTLKANTVVQLLILGISNILCWVPGACFNVASAFLPKYPIEVLLWITCVATPLNGIVNPVVFNYACAGQMFQCIRSCFSHPKKETSNNQNHKDNTVTN